MKTADSTPVVIYLHSPRFEECQQRVFYHARQQFDSTPQTPPQSNKGGITSHLPKLVKKVSQMNQADIYVKRKQLLEKQRRLKEVIERVYSPNSILEPQQCLESQLIMLPIPDLGLKQRIESTDESQSFERESSYLPSSIWEHTSGSYKEKPKRKVHLG
jgi:hypothetical protein